MASFPYLAHFISYPPQFLYFPHKFPPNHQSLIIRLIQSFLLFMDPDPDSDLQTRDGDSFYFLYACFCRQAKLCRSIRRIRTHCAIYHNIIVNGEDLQLEEQKVVDEVPSCIYRVIAPAEKIGTYSQPIFRMQGDNILPGQITKQGTFEAIGPAYSPQIILQPLYEIYFQVQQPSGLEIQILNQFRLYLRKRSNIKEEKITIINPNRLIRLVNKFYSKNRIYFEECQQEKLRALHRFCAFLNESGHSKLKLEFDQFFQEKREAQNKSEKILFEEQSDSQIKSQAERNRRGRDRSYYPDHMELHQNKPPLQALIESGSEHPIKQEQGAIKQFFVYKTQSQIQLSGNIKKEKANPEVGENDQGDQRESKCENKQKQKEKKQDQEEQIEEKKQAQSQEESRELNSEQQNKDKISEKESRKSKHEGEKQGNTEEPSSQKVEEEHQEDEKQQSGQQQKQVQQSCDKLQPGVIESEQNQDQSKKSQSQ